MSNFLRYLHWETWHFLRNRVAMIGTVVFLIVGLFAVMNGVLWQSQEDARLHAVQSDGDQTLAKSRQTALAIVQGRSKAPSPFADPTDPAIVAGAGNGGGVVATLPVAPLGSLAVGQADLHPRYLRVALRPAYELTARYELQNPTFLGYGRFDCSFVFVVLLPLFLLVISHNLFATELQSGTLALVSAQGTSLGTLAAARLAVRFAAGFAVCLCCILVAILCGPHTSYGSSLVVAAELLGVISLYTLMWLGIALLTNLFIRRAAAASIALLSVWVALVVVWPGMISLISSMLYPAPSRIEMVQSYRRASANAAKGGAKSLQVYLHDHPELVEGGTSGAQMTSYYATAVAVQNLTENAVEPILKSFDQRREQRGGWLATVSRLSPATTMQLAIEDASGSGDRRYQEFMNQFHTFLSRWRQFFLPLIFEKHVMDDMAYAQIPKFQFVEQGAATISRLLLLYALSLAVPTIAILALCTWLLSRFKPIY